jgi:hypothetical protein
MNGNVHVRFCSRVEVATPRLRQRGQVASHNPTGEARERRSAATVVGVIRERGRRRRPLEAISRQLYNPALYLCASGRLYRNDGAVTPGVTAETVDAMSLEKIERILTAVRYER